jgi:hypothetical protein
MSAQNRVGSRKKSQREAKRTVEKMTKAKADATKKTPKQTSPAPAGAASKTAEVK